MPFILVILEFSSYTSYRLLEVKLGLLKAKLVRALLVASKVS